MTYLTTGNGVRQVKVQVLFENQNEKPKQRVERKKGFEEIVQFAHNEPIKGNLTIEMANPKKNFPFNALKLEMIAQIGLFSFFFLSSDYS